MKSRRTRRRKFKFNFPLALTLAIIAIATFSFGLGAYVSHASVTLNGSGVTASSTSGNFLELTSSTNTLFSVNNSGDVGANQFYGETGSTTPVPNLSFTSSGGLNVNAGGTNQNINLNPSGTGATVVNNFQDAGGQIYNVKATYGTGIGGLVGDGVALYGCSISSGSDSLTCPTADFTPADVGKQIRVNSPFSPSTGMVPTIATFVSSTNVLLSVTAPTTFNPANVVYGTNNSPALNALISYVVNAGGGTLYFPKGIYVFDGPATSAGFDIDIPTGKAAIQFEGPTSYINTGLFSTPGTSGATLWMIGGLVQNDSFIGVEPSTTGGFSGIGVVMKNLQVVTPYGLPITAVNLAYAAGADLSHVAIDPNRTITTTYPTKPTESGNIGLILPLVGNGGTVNLYDVTVDLYYKAVEASEHANFINTFIADSVDAVVNNTNSTPHAIFFDNAQMMDCGIDILLGYQPSPMFGSIDVEGGTTVAAPGTTPLGSGFLYMNFVSPTTGPVLTNISPDLQYVVGTSGIDSLTTINLKGTITTLAGTTAGNLYWSQPFQGSEYKKAVLNFQGFENTSTVAQTVTFPTAFSYTPSVVGCTLPTGITVSTSSMSASSMSGAFTGQCIVEGQ